MKYESKTYHKTLVNAGETAEGSKFLEEHAIRRIQEFGNSDKIITACTLDIEYLNGSESGDNTLETDADTSDYLEPDLLELGKITPGVTIKETIIKYLERVSARGRLNDAQFKRFRNTISYVYNKLVAGSAGTRKDTSINSVLDTMHTGYRVIYVHPTSATPEEFYYVEKIRSTYDANPGANNKDALPSDVIEVFKNPDVKKRLQEFMDVWFNNGKSKVYDKDRDEFYHEFATLYQSILHPMKDVDENGVLNIVRSRKVIAMRPMITYPEINKILQAAGFNYQIAYRQELATDDESIEYHHSLSLR